MTEVARTRNADAVKLLQAEGFSFEKWGVSLLEVQTPDDNQVSFSVRPLCSDIITIHLLAPAQVSIIETLAARETGDALVVSGTFIASRTMPGEPPRPPDADHFEKSVTERGSMEEPEFRAKLR